MQFISYFLATGAAASFGMTEEFKRLAGSDNKFLNTSNAAASLCLIGFFFSAVSSVFSSYNLPKRAWYKNKNIKKNSFFSSGLI